MNTRKGIVNIAARFLLIPISYINLIDAYKFFEDKTNLSKKEKKLYQKLETLSRNFIFKHTRKKPLTNISIVHI